MANTNSLGKIGEDLAAQYLIDKGYMILERNWRAYRKEIDIIAIDGKDIVFIEVKTRNNNVYGDPEMAVNRKKRAHIYAAASAYYFQHKIELDVRFDIISILYHHGNPEINHIEDAFLSI
ncbi:MAG: YraN family protein [Bacteroidales bacterium]|nr:YraN family protein [Bacteroidales bacterium]